MTVIPPTEARYGDGSIDGDSSPLADTVLRPMLVIASLGAAAIHFGFAPMHLEENKVHGLFFVTIAWLQVAWAFAVSRQPSRLVYRLGIVLNLAILGVWLVSRTIGINGEVEPFGWPDSLAAALEVFIVIGSFRPLVDRLPGMRVPELTRGLALGASAILIAVAVSATMLPSLSGHSSAGGHHHGAGEETVAVVAPFDPADGVDLSGVPGVSAQQQADAEAIVEKTLDGLPQWSDQAVALAAGFHSIGDAFTGTEHLINEKNMDDDVIFDPSKPESLVYDVKDGKKTLAAAMYMLKRGTPLADAPTTGGTLMQWHIHNNLCYNSAGKVGGLTRADGTCPPPLVLPEETPMIHVWIRPNECGPFAALEGIGAGAIAEGETRLCDHVHAS